MSRKLPSILHEESIRQGLKSINSLGQPNWSLRIVDELGPPSHVLEVHYKLKNFKKTWEFLNLIAKQSDLKKHHPTIITTYNKIDIELTTHDVGNNITDEDLNLAESIHKEYYNLISQKPNQ
ncbi:hypothetical protein KGF54_004828 [Candida jiufengensis]|uniref:uncharacterized protein n=1 Tax=Candida jiufengensis TaxID=497108 RepID=UPI0022248E49|nr:uncharacterized protein KGF54_004828 [Candida jiufengensis]KAI5951753.1 hypothetical protein KGF54_004828 [Candida jiufengensis]